MRAHARKIDPSPFLLILVALARPAFAHHSFAAEYDAQQPITLSGTIARVEFVNPHAWVYIDAPDADGKLTRWNVEMGSPNALIRRGINQNTVPVGTQVSIDGYRAKDGSNTINSTTIKLPDGRALFSGSQVMGSPGEKSGQ